MTITMEASRSKR